MDRFEAMSMVLAVAEAGSLSAAARRHKTPLATVSRKVSELEAQLRTKLFNRSSRALVPTDAVVPTSPGRSESCRWGRSLHLQERRQPLSLDLDSFILPHHCVPALGSLRRRDGETRCTCRPHLTTKILKASVRPFMPRVSAIWSRQPLTARLRRHYRSRRKRR